MESIIITTAPLWRAPDLHRVRAGRGRKKTCGSSGRGIVITAVHRENCFTVSKISGFEGQNSCGRQKRVVSAFLTEVSELLIV